MDGREVVPSPETSAHPRCRWRRERGTGADCPPVQDLPSDRPCPHTGVATGGGRRPRWRALPGPRPRVARTPRAGSALARRPGRSLRGPGRIRTFEGRTGRFTVCSLWPLGHRPAGGQGYRFAQGYCFAMPTFDVVSEVDMQEVRNAVDQANREATTRFDFKGTDSTIELNDKELILASSTEDRLRALFQVLQEKMVKREVSLKSFDVGKIEEASKGTARQRLGIQAGISSDHAKKINKFVKDLGLKGVSSQTQGEQLRVTGKKRDDLQAVIAALKGEDFGIPLQFNNFRD